MGNDERNGDRCATGGLPRRGAGLSVSDGELKPIRSALLEGAGIRHGFFTREGGVSDGIYASLNAGRGSRDEAAHVAENRGRIARTLGVAPDALISMNQTHSPDVLVVDAPRTDRPRVDALVTRTKGLALGVLHADCAPVLFADGEAGVVGGAHSGWRGAVGGVLEATLAAMTALGAKSSRIVAAIGPTIAQPSYEVGPEFPAPIVAAIPEAAAFFTPSTRAAHHHFDLPGYIVMRLRRAGVEAIDDLGLDTYRDEKLFFSYRRATHRGEADYGRLLSAISLEG